MSFYLVSSWGADGVYTGKELRFFNTTDEKSAFSRKYLEDYGERVHFFKPKDLKEIIAFIYYDIILSLGDSAVVYKEIAEIYDDIVFLFGLDFINEKFPNEEMNDEFVKSVEKLSDEMLQDLDDAEDEIHLKSNISNDGKSDWEISYDDETSKWDEETDGSWRVDNDFG